MRELKPDQMHDSEERESRTISVQSGWMVLLLSLLQCLSQELENRTIRKVQHEVRAVKIFSWHMRGPHYSYRTTAQLV